MNKIYSAFFSSFCYIIAKIINKLAKYRIHSFQFNHNLAFLARVREKNKSLSLKSFLAIEIKSATLLGFPPVFGRFKKTRLKPQYS